MNPVKDIENILTPTIKKNNSFSYVQDLIETIGHVDLKPDPKEIQQAMVLLRRKYHIQPSKVEMQKIYEENFIDININMNLERHLIKSEMRSRSGVLVCTIVLPPIVDCKFKCTYCPREKNKNGKSTQPTSYLSTEPAMLRALQYDFDTLGQLWDRIKCYIKTGNIKNVDTGLKYKLEIIVSGGTWEMYPRDIREKIITEIYWSANIFNTKNTKRPMLTLEEEIKINETAQFLIIGLTLETRPDMITKYSIMEYRRFNVTRMQIGVQHYDDDILDFNKRECKTDKVIEAIMLLKQCGFKIVVHLMPDLPSSTPERDMWMFQQALTQSKLQFDDIKIYPTAICKSEDENIIVTSDIAAWYEEGTYMPYAEKNIHDLIKVLKYYKTHCPPWVRIQRLVRDIPSTSIIAGYEKMSNLRQYIENQMKKEGTRCQCIRCMEIDHNDIIDPRVVVYKYDASGGIEYHIQIETFNNNYWNHKFFEIKDYLSQLFLSKKLYYPGCKKTRKHVIGFCRLRIDNNPGGGFIKELANCALIREVHVYGSSISIGNNQSKSSQHSGFGKLLVKTAEDIAMQNHNSMKMAIIAGVGTRKYYSDKCNYNLEGTYMVKKLTNFTKTKDNSKIFIMKLLSVFIILLGIFFCFF